jgi:hypothetical protein
MLISQQRFGAQAYLLHSFKPNQILCFALMQETIPGYSSGV